MDKILHDPKDPKLWELWYIFLIVGNAGFCPSTGGVDLGFRGLGAFRVFRS